MTHPELNLSRVSLFLNPTWMLIHAEDADFLVTDTLSFQPEGEILTTVVKISPAPPVIYPKRTNQAGVSRCGSLLRNNVNW